MICLIDGIKPLLGKNKFTLECERMHWTREAQCADLVCGSAYKKVTRGYPEY